MTNLGAESINKVKVYGRQTGEEFPTWSQEFELAATINSPTPLIEADNKPQHSILKVKPKKSNNLLPTQATNPAPQKLTNKERWANPPFPKCNAPIMGATSTSRALSDFFGPLGLVSSKK